MKRWMMLFIFLLILIGPNINWAFINYVEENIEATNLNENRNLASLEPMTIDNFRRYPQMVEAYVNDHAPFRSDIIDLYTYINLKVFNSITTTTNVVRQTQIPDTASNKTKETKETKEAKETAGSQNKLENAGKEIEGTKEKTDQKTETKSALKMLERVAGVMKEALEEAVLYSQSAELEKSSSADNSASSSEDDQLTTEAAQASETTEEEIREKSSAKRIEEARAKIAEEASTEADQGAIAKKAAQQQAVVEAREALETQVLENPKEKIIKETESGNDDLKINLVIQGKEDWFFYAGEDSIIDSLGVEPFTDEQHANILEKLIKVRNKYTKENRNFVLFIPPNKERIYSEYVPDQYKNITGTSRVEELVKYIRKNSDINVVYPRKELMDAKPICDVYYKSDTHWNMVGGYVGARSLIGALMGSLDPLTFLKIEGKPFVVGGDLQLMARIPDGWINDMYYNILGLTDVPIDATYVLNDEEQTGKGLIVAHANAPRDSRKIVMIRDSYVMNMIPEILSYFEQSTLIHWQKVKSTEKEYFEGGDIFVIEYVERYLRDLETLLDEILAK